MIDTKFIILDTENVAVGKTQQKIKKIYII